MIEFLNIVMILYHPQNIIKMFFVLCITKTFTIESKINYTMEIVVI